jgi:hypothetical protein
VNATGACTGRFSCPGIRLPAPIRIEGSYGRESVSYQIERDGRARRIGKIPSPFPYGAVFGSAPGVWWAARHGHLVVGRGMNPVWRSHGVIASRWQLGVVTLGPHTVAFQHDHKLYLARLDGAERPVASREMPLGWTADGLYTYQYQSRAFLLRSDTGELLKTIGRQPFGSNYFVASGSLYFITHGVLRRAQGARVHPLVSLRHLRLSARSVWMQPIGRLLELQDARHIVLLRSDGSLFAWTPLRGSEQRAENEVSFLDITPSASAVAFILAANQTAYVLRAGAHTALPVYTEHAELTGCAHWARLAWHRNWLLYNDAEGRLTVIDSIGAPRVIDLSGLARSLPGAQPGFSAYWSGQSPEL